MKKGMPFLMVALAALAAAGPAVAATAPSAPSADLAVVDVLRGLPVAQPADASDWLSAAPCPDQVCHYVPALPGNPAHYNCATQTNSKCTVGDPATTCKDEICRKPVATAEEAQSGEL